jgi:acetyl-CoA synthetase
VYVDSAIESVLKEKRVFKTDPAFARKANVPGVTAYRRLQKEAERNYERYWARLAKEHVTWFKPWKKVLSWKAPFAKWFIGGKTNVSYNCLDRHLEGENAWRRNKAAIIWEGEPGDQRVLTYGDLHREVCKFANVLKGLGVKKGDRVAIYMPMVPELPIAMLACARIGAPHSIVFGGFSAESLRDRINDAEASCLITADGGWRRGTIVALKKMADDALEGCPTIQSVVVVERTREGVPMKEGRDHWWHELMKDASHRCPAASLDSEHPLYLLYTSGTTGKPKGILHTTGGYLVHSTVTAKWIFDLKEDDTFWCTADIRRDEPDVRGCTELARFRPLLGDRRPPSRHCVLHGADRDPQLHALGRRAREEALAGLAAPAGHRRRTDQPRGLDLIPPHDREAPLSDRGHLVADGDRRDPDHADSGRGGDQAGLGHAPLPGRLRGHL